jgi:hypothetical protein
MILYYQVKEKESKKILVSLNINPTSSAKEFKEIKQLKQGFKDK